MSTPDAVERDRIKYDATSSILYVRASLRPFAAQIKKGGGVDGFLRDYFDFEELLVPFFTGARPFWKKRILTPETNSGALGKMVVGLQGAIASRHPSHRFAGIGPRVGEVLAQHDENASCFYPIGELGRRHDFSMLLLGCVTESPGFSTIHVVQNELGLSQKHLDRYLLRWDYERNGRITSKVAPESPGCSMSFGKFYSAYAADHNFSRGTILGTEFIFIPSARRAMAVERAILATTPRFVDCGRATCITCRARLY